MPKFAFLFPGQGSQRVGMGAEFYRDVPAARALFERANAALGYDLARLCFEGPEEELKQTIHTQPALFVSSCAALEALNGRIQAQPFAVAGHSVGEYAALYAAGALPFEEALGLVRRRAELMQEAAQRRPGAMAAVLGPDAEVVRAACEQARTESGKVVAVANYNCPGQIVISGEEAGVARAAEILKERGAKRVLPLPVSGAFHSPLMVAAGDALYASLREAQFARPRVPVVVNVTAEYNRAASDFSGFLTMQVSGPVRWEESMRLLLGDGVTTFVELGAGDVLTGLMKRIDRSATALSVHDMASLESAASVLATLQEASDTKRVESETRKPGFTPAAVIFHIARKDVWDSGRAEGAYRDPSLEAEGFIHASLASQVEGTANQFFRARHGLTLLALAGDRVRAEIRYEPAANGQLYPHIYGPINPDAVIEAIDFEPGPDGRFSLPARARALAGA